MLAEIGYADVLLTRELPDGKLEIIDGHLRAETTPDQQVPVLVLDVDEHEADTLLATLDPLAAMAEANKEKLDSLLREVQTGDEMLTKMLDDLRQDPWYRGDRRVAHAGPRAADRPRRGTAKGVGHGERPALGDCR